MAAEQDPLLIKALSLARACGLSRNERMELTNMLLPGNNDFKTWNTLTPEQLSAVAYALEGHVLILELIQMRFPSKPAQQ